MNINNVKRDKINKEVNKRAFHFIKKKKLINIKYRRFKLNFLKLSFLSLSKTILVFKSICNRFSF